MEKRKTHRHSSNKREMGKNFAQHGDSLTLRGYEASECMKHEHAYIIEWTLIHGRLSLIGTTVRQPMTTERLRGRLTFELDAINSESLFPKCTRA